MLNETFRKFANLAAHWLGTPAAFGCALVFILVWAACGPLYEYSENWQLTVNTGTTIVTFLMVFLIQNTQNRDARAIHLKIDELIRSNGDARNFLLDAEKMSDDELESLHEEFCELQKHAARHIANREAQKQAST